MKRVLKIVGKISAFVGVTLGMVVVALAITMALICHGPSQSAKEVFATTILETGQVKFLANIFLTKEEIAEIVAKNSLSEMENEMDTNLIKVVDTTDTEKELIEIHKITGNGFEGTMMVVNDPSKISLATTYPWGEYGKTLDEIVEENNALAGVNGGLYLSVANKGGRPLGVTVTNHQIVDNNPHINGLYLIGFDDSNILRIIPLAGMNATQVEELVSKEKIRDAVSFQEEASVENNHFVKLIINGEKRDINGDGSGRNPRTAIGQRKDGSVLFLVTDGRGKNNHLGATARDLIEIMTEYGAVNAANVDGGSSSCMYYNGEYLRTSVTFYYTNSSWRLPTAFVVKE